MGITFERPIGVSADVAELEFIAALHQTCQPKLRRDGSITATDVMHFLSSRYGIRVTVQEVRETILKGLAGGECADECIDLAEMLAILMIPEIVKVANDNYNISSRDNITERSREDFESDWEYEDHKRRIKLANERKPDSRIIERVLNMILKDATGDATPKLLNKELIKTIFAAYGEKDLVDDDELIDNMILAASGGKENAVLDHYTFARALSGDVQKYDISSETEVTTHYFDVFQTLYSTKSKKSGKFSLPSSHQSGIPTTEVFQDEEERGRTMPNGDNVREVEREFTAPSIDYTADTYRSKTFVILLWITAVNTYFAYVYTSLGSFGRLDCAVAKSEFACKIGSSVIGWLVILTQLSVLGFIFIFCGSMGNSIYFTNRIWTVVGMVAITFGTIVPFYSEVKTPFFDTTKFNTQESWLRYGLSLILGGVLICAQIFNFIRLSIPMKFFDKRKRLARYFTSGVAVAESKLKLASAFKINRMIKNAEEIHDATGSESSSKVADTAYGKALLNYAKLGEKHETTGGMFWTWKRIISGKLFIEEGIWFSSRILAGNCYQIISCASFFFFAFGVTHYVIRPLYNDDIDVPFGVPEWVSVFSTSVGTTCGLLAGLSISAIYIPSSVSTVLKYRSGEIASLKSSQFPLLRTRLESISLLLGSLLWGVGITCVLVWLIISTILFLLLWEVTRPFVIDICAIILGLMITIGFKSTVIYFLRRNFYAAFYRKKPALANFMGLVLECWYLGLTSGYMLLRTSELLAATALSIGRIDRPFLSGESAIVGPVNLDRYPQLFLKDLLSHEAHRHPYLERMGMIYMLKLRHGENFAKTCGSCWRLLFVFALMPWMRKYRIINEDGIDESNFNFGSGKKWGRRPPPRRTMLRRRDRRLSEEDLFQEEESTESIQTLKQQNKRMGEELKRLRMELENINNTP